MGEWHATVGWELVAFALTLGYPLVLVVVGARAIAARVMQGRLALGPLAVLLLALPGVAAVRRADGALHDRRFTRHLTEVEAMVARAAVENGGRLRLPLDSLPPAVRDCTRLVLVRRDHAGHLSATFLGRRNTSYLYDPTGVRLQRGLTSGRWRSSTRLAPDWYRVVRF